MKLEEAQQILKENGYIVENVLQPLQQNINLKHLKKSIDELQMLYNAFYNISNNIITLLNKEFNNSNGRCVVGNYRDMPNTWYLKIVPKEGDYLKIEIDDYGAGGLYLSYEINGNKNGISLKYVDGDYDDVINVKDSYLNTIREILEQ